MSGIPDDILAAATAVEDEIMACDLHDLDTQVIIAKAILAERDRCVAIARQYSVGFEKALGLYGSADKDAGRGRQEGHINAGREIAGLIETGIAPPKLTREQAMDQLIAMSAEELGEPFSSKGGE